MAASEIAPVKPPRSPRLFWICGIILIVLSVYLGVQNALTNVRIRFAEEQTAVFDEMRDNLAKTQDPTQEAGFLAYVLEYYPSGTKQLADSPLDRLVERARRNVVREMLGILRERTGHEFGDNPQRWIEHLRTIKRR